jgi:gamma-glutamyltranspeptidase / glutathione hydrolase
MSDRFSDNLQYRKPAIKSRGGVMIKSRGGIVAAQSRRAAEIGAAVLADGGDCIDSVVATAFALGVLEPWMNGVGGGAMVLCRAGENRCEVIDYGMRAPLSLRSTHLSPSWSGKDAGRVPSEIEPGAGAKRPNP